MAIRNNRNLYEVNPVYSPRSSYKKIKTRDQKMIADMTLNFDKLTINLLKDQFIKRNNQLNLQEFIIIAKKHLKFWQNDIPNREIALMRYLTFLFNQIDINGNGDMEWDEFTNYIIQKATVLKNLKSKADQIKNYVRSKAKPKMKIDGIIQKCQYIDEIDKIAFYEEGENKISFMNPDNGEISKKSITVDPKRLIVNISSVKKQKNGKVSIRKKNLDLQTDVRVLDMIYLSEKKYKVLLVSTSDGYVRGWRHSQNGFYLANQPDNQEQLFEHYFPSQIYCLAWDNINEVLYCGQKNGSIYMWNLKTDLEKPLCDSKTMSNQKDYQQQKVNWMITSMITMPKLQFMASGRMDGKLILWDTINNKKKWIYSEHSRGVLTLSFNEAMILLFSAGFDHKICIWNPYISTLIHKIEGHLAPILSLKVIEGTHQLISVDTEGIVKITDTRRFNFIYSFSVEANDDGSNSSSLSSLLIIKKPLKLVFSGRSIYIYEYDKNYHPHIVDENTAICCKYIKEKLCFFTPTGNKIKVWSALNGDVERIYMDVTPFEISTFQFDFLKKRMVVGDTKGNITLHNTANGAKMKNLSKHNGEITHLIATQISSVDIFISCALDNEIRIFKETQQSYQIIRTIHLRKDVSVTCLNYCSITKLIMVGSNVGTLDFYDIQTGKTAGSCFNRSYQEFTGISKTKQSMIITSSSSGKISVIALPPLPNRFDKIFLFHHTDPEKPGSFLGVRTVSYSDSLNMVFLIDDKMNLNCYSFENIDFKKCKEITEKVESIRRTIVTKMFDNIKIDLKWQVKAHNQVVKSLQYIEEEELLITTSFDKKVKIWRAQTGQFIDSLQQNYCKGETEPIGYFDKRNQTLFSSDFKNSKVARDIDPVKMEFDPFAFQKTLQNCPQVVNSKHSNKEWKVFVDFREIAQKEMNKFGQLANRISKNENTSKQLKHFNKIKASEIKQKLGEQRKQVKMLKDIQELKYIDSNFIDLERQKENIQNQETSRDFKQTKQLNEGQKLQQMAKKMVTQDRGTSKKISTNYFRRSVVNCLQNFIDHKQNDEMLEKQQRKQKFHKDYIPIYQVLKNREKTRDQLESHRKYIEDLYKRGTQSSNNGRSEQRIVLGRKQADAAKKFYKMLSKTDEKDKRIEHIAQNIYVKQKENTPFPRLHS